MELDLRKKLILKDTKFKYQTNFEGNPANCARYASTERNGNVIIKDEELALALRDAGVSVRNTEPREEDDPATFIPEYFAKVKLAYRDRYGELKPESKQPRVFIENGDTGRLTPLTEETVSEIDELCRNRYVKSVDVVLNIYYNNDYDSHTLWIDEMYVVQDVDSDPFYYKHKRNADLNDIAEEAQF